MSLQTQASSWGQAHNAIKMWRKILKASSHICIISFFLLWFTALLFPFSLLFISPNFSNLLRSLWILTLALSFFFLVWLCIMKKVMFHIQGYRWWLRTQTFLITVLLIPIPQYKSVFFSSVGQEALKVQLPKVFFVLFYFLLPLVSPIFIFPPNCASNERRI